eukprot:s8273_g1.t1
MRCSCEPYIVYAAVAQELALLETQLNDAANTNGEAEAMVLEACMRQETPEIRRTALGILDKWAPGVYPRDPGGVGHRDGRPDWLREQLGRKEQKIEHTRAEMYGDLTHRPRITRAAQRLSADRGDQEP